MITNTNTINFNATKIFISTQERMFKFDMANKARENEFNITEIMSRFRNDSKMCERQWRKFCKRYYGKNVSTVAFYLECLYGEMPKNICSLIQQELKRQVSNMEVCE